MLNYALAIKINVSYKLNDRIICILQLVSLHLSQSKAESHGSNAVILQR